MTSRTEYYRQYRLKHRARLSETKRAWYIANHQRKRPQNVDDPAMIEARITAMREAKLARFDRTGSFALPQGASLLIQLPGD